MNSHSASSGTLPSTAAYAIGMPKPKAMPSTACGIEKNRLVNG